MRRICLLSLIVLLATGCWKVGPVESIEQLAVKREESRDLERSSRYLFQLISIHYYEGVRSLYPPSRRREVDPERVITEKFDIPIESLDQVAAEVLVRHIEFAPGLHPGWARVPVDVSYHDLRKDVTRRRRVFIRWIEEGGQWFIDAGTQPESVPAKSRQTGPSAKQGIE